MRNTGPANNMLSGSPLAWVEEEFIQEFESTPISEKTAWRHKCIQHKLPIEAGRIMKQGIGNWPALTEDNINKATAGWSWVHKYAELLAQEVVMPIGSGRLSKLVRPCTNRATH